MTGRRGVEMGVRSKNVDSWISEHDPSIRQIATFIRELIWQEEPDFKEAIKWSNPVYEKRGKVCYLSATDYYVMLGFFNGAALTDPEGRIGGTGKRMRNLRIRSLEDVDADQVRSWIREAVENDSREPV